MSNVEGNQQKASLPPRTSARWKHIGATLARFFTLQIITQALLGVAGIILVRTLSRTEYAYFTIANTTQSAMNLLADSGISIGVMAIGGKFWEDKHRFGQLINTALTLRKQVAIAVIFTTTPIALWTLYSNNSPIYYCIILVVATLTALYSQIKIGVLEVVPRLRSEFMRFSRLELWLAATRLFLVILAYFLFCNAVIAILIGSATLLIKSSFLGKWALEGIEKEAPTSIEDKKELSSIIRRQSPGFLFYCLQGQITTWLLSYFGAVISIAEVGALSGLTVVFGLMNSLTGNIVVPKFAKIQEMSALKSFYWRTLASYSSIFLALLILAWYAPNQILWLLGGKYKHLQEALLLMMLVSIFTNLISLIWSLNAARAWIHFSWLNIPFTLTLQVILLFVMKVNNTHSALLFSLFSLIPNFFVNIFLSYKGFKVFSREHSAKTTSPMSFQ